MGGSESRVQGAGDSGVDILSGVLSGLDRPWSGLQRGDLTKQFSLPNDLSSLLLFSQISLVRRGIHRLAKSKRGLVMTSLGPLMHVIYFVNSKKKKGFLSSQMEIKSNSFSENEMPFYSSN